MCNKECKCKDSVKTIARKTYLETNKEFFAKKGLLCPIYADRIVNDLFKGVSKDGTAVINNVLALMQGHESVSNKVIGYFSALPDTDKTAEHKYTLAMSFCVPSDYKDFDRDFGRYVAMKKVMGGSGMFAHVNRIQQVIFSPYCTTMYYFGYGCTVSHQFDSFIEKCNKYYK